MEFELKQKRTKGHGKGYFHYFCNKEISELLKSRGTAKVKCTFTCFGAVLSEIIELVSLSLFVIFAYLL